MAFATWWRGDPLPNLSPLPSFSAHASTDAMFIASVTSHDPQAIATRFQRGNRCYLAFKSDSIFGFLGSMFGHQTIRAQICPKIEPIYQDLRKYQSLQSNLKLKFDRFILATTEVDIASEVQAELAKLRNSAVFLRGNLMEG
jgi:hypothetical protein